MKKHSVTFYDAIYHAIALTQKGLPVTADEAYYRKVKRIAHIPVKRLFAVTDASKPMILKTAVTCHFEEAQAALSVS
jgi:hypothetical protein